MSEEKQIMDAIEAYLEAIKTGDEDMFNRAFRSDSVVIFASESDDDKLVTSIKDFAERVKQRHEAGTNVEEIPLGISSSYLGKVGNVRVDFKLVIGEQTLYGTDYFNLIKRDNEWKISQKIYDVTKTESQT
jgi:hypothetical protein